MRTREQARAQNALQAVPATGGREFLKRYRAYVDRLGPAILRNGLGQALATERAAAGPQPSGDDSRAHQQLAQNLERWLCRSGDGVYPESGDLLASLMAGEQALYLQAQVEALAWLEWHKNFFRAALPSGRD